MTLKDTVRLIFKIITHAVLKYAYKYPQAVNQFPDDIIFITTTNWSNVSGTKQLKERGNLITKEHHYAYLMQIGDKPAKAESRMTHKNRTRWLEIKTVIFFSVSNLKLCFLRSPRSGYPCWWSFKRTAWKSAVLIVWNFHTTNALNGRVYNNTAGIE